METLIQVVVGIALVWVVYRLLTSFSETDFWGSGWVGHDPSLQRLTLRNRLLTEEDRHNFVAPKPRINFPR